MRILLESIDESIICNYTIRGKAAEKMVRLRHQQCPDEDGYAIIFMDIVMPE